MANHSFDALVTFYLKTSAMLLRALRVPPEAVQYLSEALAEGRSELISEVFAFNGISTLRGDGGKPSLADLLIRLARVLSRLRADTVESTALEEATDIAIHLSELCEKYGANGTAYNYYEIAYHFCSIRNQPALAVAEKLRALSNPEKVDQFHGAIWRLAIERVRHSCTIKGEWLAALDAYELALSCPVETADFQRQLCDSLEQQLRMARGTPIQDLVVIYFIQAPVSGISAEERQMAIRLLCEQETQSSKRQKGYHLAMEIMAMANGQVIFDDMRQCVRPMQSASPYVEWSNIAVRHDRLSGAVPLGRSLIADIERTKWLLPDLIHEIGHAVALLGGIGMSQSAFRAVTHFAEAYLVGANGDELLPGKIRALSFLPDIANALPIAVIQLRAAANATIAQAIWAPWLEGLSMYYELVCDPKDDVTQISAIHECLRLLIDFDIPRHPGETAEEYALRMANEVSVQFETFFSNALRDTSRINCLGYFDAAQRGESDIYVLGYLVVRSIVAAWEATLGRRLIPMRAAILLLNATQASTADAFPKLDLGPEDFRTACRSNMVSWLASLAALPKEAIENFLQPMASDCAGVPTLWKGMIPRTVTEEELMTALEARSTEFWEPEVLKLAGIDPCSTGTNPKNAEALLSLFSDYVIRNKLLPIGDDKARLFFMQDSDYAGVCPRTYVGKRQLDASKNRAGVPRYSHRFWKEGAAERERVRRLFGREGTSRVVATRVIDLVGFPNSPHPGRMSYVCFFLGSDYVRISSWVNPVADESKGYPEFAEVLRRRVLDSGLFQEEDSTVGSLKFLAERLERAGELPQNLQHVLSLDQKEMAVDAAMAAASAAFTGGKDAPFTTAYLEGMSTSRRRQAIARTVHSSGFGQASEAEPALANSVLALLIFSSSSFSGVRPFAS